MPTTPAAARAVHSRTLSRPAVMFALAASSPTRLRQWSYQGQESHSSVKIGSTSAGVARSGRRRDLESEGLLVVVAFERRSLRLAVRAGVGLEQGRVEVEPGQHAAAAGQVLDLVAADDEPHRWRRPGRGRWPRASASSGRAGGSRRTALVVAAARPSTCEPVGGCGKGRVRQRALRPTGDDLVRLDVAGHVPPRSDAEQQIWPPRPSAGDVVGEPAAEDHLDAGVHRRSRSQRSPGLPADVGQVDDARRRARP